MAIENVSYQIDLRMLAGVMLALLLAVRQCDSCYYDVASTSKIPDPTSAAEEEKLFEEQRLELIRFKLLNALGLDQPPKIERGGGGPALTNNVLKLPVFTKTVKVADDNKAVKKKKTKAIVFAQFGPSNPCLRPTWTQDNHSQMSFKLPDSPSQIREPILWFKATGNDPTHQMDTEEATVCSCVQPTNQNDSSSTTTINCMKITQESSWNETAKQGWSKIRLDSDWKTIINNRQRRLLLIINKKLKISDKKRPFLSMELERQPNKLSLKRPKRQAAESGPNDCVKSDESSNASSTINRPACCRTHFWVDIRQLGWSDWIISPSGFDFHYCKGHCDDGFDRIGNDDDKQELDYASVLNAYIKRMNLNLKPCCVSKKTAPLTMVITTNGHTANRTTIPNFIVEECACIGFA